MKKQNHQINFPCYWSSAVGKLLITGGIYLEVTFLAGQVKRNGVFGVPGADAGPVPQQERHELPVPVQRGHVQRRKAILV